MSETLGIVSNIKMISSTNFKKDESETKTSRYLTIDLLINGEVVQLENFMFTGEISVGDVVRVNNINIAKIEPDEKLNSSELVILDALNEYYITRHKIIGAFSKIASNSKKLSLERARIATILGGINEIMKKSNKTLCFSE